MINPYILRKLTFDKGEFDNFLDATYIIHLQGNTTRYNNIIFQLNKFVPTKTVYILFNKGFKHKNSLIDNSAKDLSDCYITIFKHNKANTILVLEDDFVWLSNIKYNKHIDKFCIDNKNENFAFYLGTFPLLFIPKTYYINYSIFNIFTHSIIYSKKLQQQVINYKIIPDWDIFMNTFITHKYHYYIPLCGQTFTKTVNSKTWTTYNTPIYDLFFDIINPFFYGDIYPEQLFYLFYLLLPVVLLICICIFTRIT